MTIRSYFKITVTKVHCQFRYFIVLFYCITESDHWAFVDDTIFVVSGSDQHSNIPSQICYRESECFQAPPRLRYDWYGFAWYLDILVYLTAS